MRCLNHLSPGPRDRISHTCDRLSASQEGQEVVLGGWVFSQRRASANLHFFTLRDHTGSVQLISKDKEVSDRLMSAALESVVQVKGVVRARKQKAKEVSVSRQIRFGDLT
jgi:aspartyl-tRNA synthetase